MSTTIVNGIALVVMLCVTNIAVKCVYIHPIILYSAPPNTVFTFNEY